MPAQMADVFSSWQVAEQPSPLVVLPSSHSSVPSTMPLPQVAGGGPLQSDGAAASFADTRPASSRRKLTKAAQWTSAPMVKRTSIGPCACVIWYGHALPPPLTMSAPPRAPERKATFRTPVDRLRSKYL